MIKTLRPGFLLFLGLSFPLISCHKPHPGVQGGGGGSSGGECLGRIIDDFQYVSGQSSVAKGFARDTSGNFYVVGQAYDGSGILHSIVRKSTDGGTTWTTKRDFQFFSGHDSYGLAITVGPDGAVYTAGGGKNAADHAMDISSRSLDGGTNWNDYGSTIFVATDSANTALFVDANSTQYFAYFYADGSGTRTWRPLRQVGSGGTLAMESYQYLGGSTSPTAVYVDASINMYFAGYGIAASTSHWLVRKSTNGGVGWANVDDYTYLGSHDASPNALGADATGNLFAAGWGKYLYYHWLTRTSSDSGANWTLVDDYQYDAHQDSKANAFTVDVSGNRYVVGYGNDSSGQSHWIVRKATAADSTSWSTVDDFQYSIGQSSVAYGIGTSSAGNVYVVGSGIYNSGTSHWLVRQLGCN